jgi:hypothetical protein
MNSKYNSWYWRYQFYVSDKMLCIASKCIVRVSYDTLAIFGLIYMYIPSTSQDCTVGILVIVDLSTPCVS